MHEVHLTPHVKSLLVALLKATVHMVIFYLGYSPSYLCSVAHLTLSATQMRAFPAERRQQTVDSIYRN